MNNKVYAVYGNIKVWFEVTNDNLSIVAKNLPQKPIILEDLYKSLGLVCEYGEDFVRLQTRSKAEGLNDRMARLYLLAARCFERSEKIQYSFNDLFPDFRSENWGNKKCNL